VLRNTSTSRRELAPFYSAIGRPSIDPELMIRMLIVGYCFGIRSERRLCDEVHLNLAYRWFCRLDLDGDVPDHSTFSKHRHGRFRESDLLRRVFETVLKRCVREGLVGGEGFAVDASLIKADANRQNGIEGEKGLPPEATGRAVEEYLAVLDDAAVGAATEVRPKFVSPADPAARARQIANSWEGKVEMLFAHLKRILKLDRLRLRGPNGAQDEYSYSDFDLNYCRPFSTESDRIGPTET
jgi:transposase